MSNIKSNLQNRPFLYLSIFFSIGIILTSFLIKKQVIPSALFLLSITLITSVLISKKIKFPIILLCISFIVLGSLTYFNGFCKKKDKLQALSEILGKKVIVEGIVDTYPSYNNLKDTTKFVLKTDRILVDEKWIVLRSKILVNIYRSKGPVQLRRGQIMDVKGLLMMPDLPSKPWEYDYKEYLSRQEIYSVLYVNSETDIFPKPEIKLSLFNRVSDYLRVRIKKVLLSGEDKNHRKNILAAMILGDRGGIPPEIKEIFIQTNTMHVLAISGLHVCIIAGLIFLFTGLLFVPLRWRYFLTVCFLLIYVVISGGRSSVLRATIMISFVLIGKMLNRKGESLNTIGLSALLMLIINPFLLFDAGFQLSYVTVISIIIIAPILDSLWQKKFCYEANIKKVYRKNDYIIRWLGKTLSVGIAAWLGSFPLVLYYFKIISPFSFIINIIVIIFLFLILIVGFFTVIIGQIFFVISLLLGKFNNIIISSLLAFLSMASNIPGCYFYTGHLCKEIIIAIYISIFLGISLINRSKKIGLLIMILPFIFLLVKEPVSNLFNKGICELDIFSIKKKLVFF
ncbi:ComEC/Rec2 family competence protein, partial [Chlamydiota bacterium]